MGGGGNNPDFWGRIGIAAVLRVATPCLILAAVLAFWLLK